MWRAVWDITVFCFLCVLRKNCQKKNLPSPRLTVEGRTVCKCLRECDYWQITSGKKWRVAGRRAWTPSRRRMIRAARPPQQQQQRSLLWINTFGCNSSKMIDPDPTLSTRWENQFYISCLFFFANCCLLFSRIESWCCTGCQSICQPAGPICARWMPQSSRVDTLSRWPGLHSNSEDTKQPREWDFQDTLRRGWASQVHRQSATTSCPGWASWGSWSSSVLQWLCLCWG